MINVNYREFMHKQIEGFLSAINVEKRTQRREELKTVVANLINSRSMDTAFPVDGPARYMITLWKRGEKNY